MIGRVLLHYEVLSQLGAGGMGEVYLAEDRRLGRKVALKVLPPDLAEDPERLRRLEREARTLGSLDHPNIVTLYSVEEAEGVHFLTMAYVEGESLDRQIAADGLPAARLVELASALADALAAAHAQGVVHRDLKPGNVMVDRSGRVRVLDFGLAKAVADPQSADLGELATMTATVDGMMVGTVPYMSPEQAEGRAVDARSDLFSLGTMLYELATGRRPFGGESAMAVASAILKDAPEDLADQRPDLPARFVRLIERCLEKDRARRVQTAQEVLDALSEVKRELDSQAYAATTVAPAVAAPKRFKVHWGLSSVAAAVLLVVSLVGFDIGGLRQRLAGLGGESPIRSLVVLPLRNLSGDESQEYFVDGMTEALITDLSKIQALKVISRTSAMRYKRTEKSLPEIARELGVEAIVEGSIMREAGRVRINAQLIRAATDENLWADSYERDLSSILALQGEIARAIAEEIRIQVTPQEATRLAAEREVDPAAYDAYLKGIFHRHLFTPQDLATAMSHFSTALEIEPEYSEAHVGAASVWAYRLVLGLVPQEEACRNWKSAIAAALAGGREIAEAHVGMAQISAVCDWNWQEADRRYRQAIAVEPGNAEAHFFYGNFLGSQLRFAEGESHIARGLELDPLNGFYHAGEGVQLAMQRRFEEAVDAFRRSFETTPGGGFGHLTYWRALYWTGDLDGAAEHLGLHLRMLRQQEAAEALATGVAEAGYAEGARQAADALAAGSLLTRTRPMVLVYLYDDAGDRESALYWLEQAYEVRDLDMAYLSTLEVSEELATDRRYVEILERLGLPVRQREG